MRKIVRSLGFVCKMTERINPFPTVRKIYVVGEGFHPLPKRKTKFIAQTPINAIPSHNGKWVFDDGENRGVNPPCFQNSSRYHTADSGILNAYICVNIPAPRADDGFSSAVVFTKRKTKRITEFDISYHDKAEANAYFP